MDLSRWGGGGSFEKMAWHGVPPFPAMEGASPGLAGITFPLRPSSVLAKNPACLVWKREQLGLAYKLLMRSHQ